MEKTPHSIGGCRIVEKLGQGGMGAVFRAQHQTLGREVAIKLLPPDFTQNPEYVQRFLREARAAAQLKHPNLVQVHDAGESGGQYYITMEYVDGRSLGQQLKQGGPLPEAEGLNYLAQAARGLAAAHERGLVHRDIKPENMLLGRDGILRIADFGLVTAVEGDAALTRSGAMLGTPTYMSPEQCEGQPADARSDIYSLGASFYRLLTGRAPFKASTPMGVLFKHKFEPPVHPRQLNPKLSEQTAQLLLRMMAKSPEGRFQSAREVLAAVEGLQRGQQSTRISPAGMLAASGQSHTPSAPSSTPPLQESATAASQAASAAATPMPSGDPASTPTLVTPPSAPNPAGPPPQSTYLGAAPATLSAKPSAFKRVALVLAALGLLGAGGWWGYRQYHRQQIAQAKQQARDARALKHYEQAIQILEEARARYPEHAALKELRDSIEAESVNGRAAQRKVSAAQKAALGHDQEAVDEYARVIALLKEHAALPGVALDPALEELKKKAENRRDFHQQMERGRAAEVAGRYREAATAYTEAAKYEAGEGRVAESAAQKATFQGLMSEAGRLEQRRQWAAALALVNQAAKLKVADVSKDQARLQRRIRHDELLVKAKVEEQAGRLRKAAAVLEQAAKLAPGDSASQALIQQARALNSDANYNDVMVRGVAALKRQGWAEAQKSFREAQKIKPQAKEPGKHLQEAQAGELAQKAETAARSNDFKSARTLYRRAAQLQPLKKAWKQAAARMAEMLKTISRLEDAARRAESEKNWVDALNSWASLQKLDPLRKDVYAQRANNVRYQISMQKGRASLQEGRLEEALGHAKIAAMYDPVRGREQIRMVEALIQERQRAQAGARAVQEADALVKKGQLAQAKGGLAAALRAAPGNAELKNLKLALEGVEAYEQALGRLEALRQDAEAAVKFSLTADKKSKEIKRWLQELRAWKAKLDAQKTAGRSAWLKRDFKALPAAFAQMRGLAREQAPYYRGLAATYRGWAIKAARPKAHIGGGIGGFGFGRHGGGGGSVGVGAPVGSNSKKAAIFDSAAQTLSRAAGEARRLGAAP